MSPSVDDVLSAVQAGSAGARELHEALAGAPLLFALATGQGERALPWILRFDGVDHGVVCTARQYADLLTDVPVFAELSGRDLGARWPAGLRAVINPGTPLALELDAAAMHALGRTQATARAGTAYAVGAPAEAPAPELVEAVRGALTHVGGAQAAYLFQFAQAGGMSRLVCGLVLAPGADPATVIPPIADAVAYRVPAAGSLDYLPLDGRLLAEVSGFVEPILSDARGANNGHA